MRSWSLDNILLRRYVCGEIYVRSSRGYSDLRGAVGTLTERGYLSCGYMGTDPSMFTPPSSEVRELDYGQLDAEMKQLQRAIKDHSGKTHTSKYMELQVYFFDLTPGMWCQKNVSRLVSACHQR